MKLCKDCKHAYVGWADWLLLDGYKFARCRRQHLQSVDKVTGETVYYNTFCSTERDDYGIIDTCGSKAKYFEAKK